MANNLDDIFASHDDGIDREQLLKYLSGELSDEERHRIEAAIVDSDMLNDAVEGLETTTDAARLPAIQNEIDARLKKYLKDRENKKEKRKIKDLSWVVIFSIIILLLILVAFWVLYVGWL